jgi:hypothetical protein
MTTVDIARLAEELASLTDAVKRLGASAQQPMQPQSSVEIARNSKGATWSVKVYDSDPITANTTAQALYDDLAARYGQPEASA